MRIGTATPCSRNCVSDQTSVTWQCVSLLILAIQRRTAAVRRLEKSYCACDAPIGIEAVSCRGEQFRLSWKCTIENLSFGIQPVFLRVTVATTPLEIQLIGQEIDVCVEIIKGRFPVLGCLGSR